MRLKYALEKDKRLLQRISDPDLSDVPSAMFTGEHGVNAEVFEREDGMLGVQVFQHGSPLDEAQFFSSLDDVTAYLASFQIPITSGWQVGWYTPL